MHVESILTGANLPPAVDSGQVFIMQRVSSDLSLMDHSFIYARCLLCNLSFWRFQ